LAASGSSDEPVAARRTWFRQFHALLLLLFPLVTGSAPKSLQLPGGASTPLADPSPVIHEALGHCTHLQSLTLEIGLSGKVGRTSLRGRLQAGFEAPSAIRLEAVAPFGAPFFILAGSEAKATLLLPRDNSVLADARPAAVLEALTGLELSPADLRAWLAGCPAVPVGVQAARSYGADWVAIDVGPGRVAWLRRTDRWRLAATADDALSIEFAGHEGVQPTRVRIWRAPTDTSVGVDARLALSQVEMNVTLPSEAFAVSVPPTATPITLEDLRSSGPLREAGGKDGERP
jgi:outer membrane biogenesis lipoprotein LolB